MNDELWEQDDTHIVQGRGTWPDGTPRTLRETSGIGKFNTPEDAALAVRARNALINREQLVKRAEDHKGEGTWVWVGDGEDHLGSITCPILIDPVKLRELLTLGGLAEAWRDEATAAREEATKLRRTFPGGTDAEDRARVRAELWDECADELEAEVNKVL